MSPWIAVLCMASCVALAADELPRGTVIPDVPCQDGKHSYALYLPSNYTPERAWPVLFCLDPRARGRVPVDVFAPAAEKMGWIIAGSNQSRNGPIDPARAAIAAMTEDAERRLHLDPLKYHAAGFSGGARLALAWGMGSPLAGVIACGAGFGADLPPRPTFRLYFIAGTEDFNYHEIVTQSIALAKGNAPHRFATFDGGHDWLPPQKALEALQYMEGRLPGLAAQPDPEERREYREMLAWQRRVSEGGPERKDTIAELRRTCDRTEDSSARRVARRSLAGMYVGSIEAGNGRMQEKAYAAAAKHFEVALLLRPEMAGAWYSLARARAADHDERGALHALAEAARQGFRDWDRADADPLFDKIRDNRRYRALRR